MLHPRDFCLGDSDYYGSLRRISLQPEHQEEPAPPALSKGTLANRYWNYSGSDIAALLKTSFISLQERQYLERQLPKRGGPTDERRDGKLPGERGFPLLTLSEF
jgi:hypothetical protein